MGRVRLTRRGRMVALILGLLLSGLAAAAVGSASQAAGTAEPQVAVVEPGDTLWSVAARHVPSSDPYRVIAEIRRLNDLDNTTIHPGQELLLPAR